MGGWKVDPALVYAHALQESIFRTSVVSPAGARGLMQIMPAAARDHAAAIGVAGNAADLNKPEINLAFGQRHLEMLKNSPGIGDGIRPNCEAYGYLLDAKGSCQYIEAWNREVAAHPGAKKVKVMDKTCLCTHMRNFEIWTCGHLTYRLKDTTRRNEDGSYQLLTAEHIFRDYQFSTGGQIALPV